MQNPEVQALLTRLGIEIPQRMDGNEGMDRMQTPSRGTGNLGETFGAFDWKADLEFELASRGEVIGRLMNLTLHCLGGIRELIAEQEKTRLSYDCMDIDGSLRHAGRRYAIERQIFVQASRTMLDVIQTGRPLNPFDPRKDIVESFPWDATILRPDWHILAWALLDPFCEQSVTAALQGLLRNEKGGIEQLQTLREGDDESSQAPTPMKEKLSVPVDDQNSFLPPISPRASTENKLPFQNPTEKEKTVLLAQTEEAVQVQQQLQEMDQAILKTTQRLDMTHPDIEGEDWNVVASTALTNTRSQLNEEQYSRDYIQLIRKVLRCAPESTSEIDRFGQHYLLYALRAGSQPVLEELLKYHPAIVTIRDGRGKIALHYCAQYSPTVEALLTISNAMNEPLEKLATSIRDQHGNLPVHFASMGASSPSVLKELSYRAPTALQVANDDGQLPLHLAAMGAQAEKVRLLLASYPQAIDSTDRNGWSSLQLAAYHSQSVDVVRILHKASPMSIEQLHSSGRVPLHYAVVRCESSKIVRYLANAYPASVNIADRNGRLPLHNLIARTEFMTPTRLRCLRYLLEVDPKTAAVKDRDNRTAYDLAVRNNLGPLVYRLLLRADPVQNPELLGELSYLASKSKYRSQSKNARAEKTRSRLQKMGSYSTNASQSRRNSVDSNISYESEYTPRHRSGRRGSRRGRTYSYDSTSYTGSYDDDDVSYGDHSTYRSDRRSANDTASSYDNVSRYTQGNSSSARQTYESGSRQSRQYRDDNYTRSSYPDTASLASYDTGTRYSSVHDYRRRSSRFSRPQSGYAETDDGSYNTRSMDYDSAEEDDYFSDGSYYSSSYGSGSDDDSYDDFSSSASSAVRSTSHPPTNYAPRNR